MMTRNKEVKDKKVSSRGFTLIELLVVIAIIALLLSVMLPSLRKAKNIAKAIVCRNNLHQMSVALQSYYTDNNNKALVDDGSTKFWFIDIAPYLGESNVGIADSAGSSPEDLLKATMELLKCPATKEPVKPWDSTMTAYDNRSKGTARNQYRYHVVRAEGAYGMNAWVGGWVGAAAYPECDFRPESTVGQQNLRLSYRSVGCTKSNVPVIADSVWVDATARGTDAVPSDLSSGAQNIGTEFGLERLCTIRHEKNTNIAFADGHAEKVPLEQLWTLSWNKKFEKNFDIRIDYSAN